MSVSLEDLRILSDGLKRLHFDVVVRHPDSRRILRGVESTKADVDLEDEFERLVRRHLGSDVVVIGEEAITANRVPTGRGPSTILVDPIDGTRLYRAGHPGYACTFAIACRGRLLAGCVYLPDQEDCYLIVRGDRMYRNGVALMGNRPDGLPLVAMRSADMTGLPGLPEAFEAAGFRVERLGSVARRLIEAAHGSIAGVVKTVGLTNGMPRLWGVAAGFLACEAMGLGFWLDQTRRLVAVGERRIVTTLGELNELDLQEMDLDTLWSCLWTDAAVPSRPSHSN